MQPDRAGQLPDRDDPSRFLSRLPEPKGHPDFQRRRQTGTATRDFCAVCTLPGEERGRQGQKRRKKEKKAEGSVNTGFVSDKTGSRKVLFPSGGLADRTGRADSQTIVKFLAGDRWPEVWRFCRAAGPPKRCCVRDKAGSRKVLVLLAGWVPGPQGWRFGCCCGSDKTG